MRKPRFSDRPDLKQIEEDIKRGELNDVEIARKYSVHRSSIWRHRTKLGIKRKPADSPKKP